jgi:diguanylate cyclase (GGDEF)-like protein
VLGLDVLGHAVPATTDDGREEWTSTPNVIDLREHHVNHGDRTAAARDVESARRDGEAADRDAAAAVRDRAAEQRDDLAEECEARADPGLTVQETARSAALRGEARADRGKAAQDRQASAAARTMAGLDRDAASADRRRSAGDRQSAATDVMTGVFGREAGFVELAREVDRASRNGQPMVVAFIDVDHLKVINDSQGHAAGDAMLLAVTTALRGQLRSYDLIFRYGGDEFVCALSGLSIEQAKDRFASVNAILADAHGSGSISIGLIDLGHGDSARQLVARADAALYSQRRSSRMPSQT